MKKVLLISLPSFEENTENMYPLGMGYLAAAIKNKHKVKVYHYDSMSIAKKEISEVMKTFNPDIIGFTCNTFIRSNVKLMINFLRKIKPKALYVVGGVHASYCPEQVLRHYKADIVVIGEGEITMQEICDNLESKKSYNNILGIAFLKKGKFIQNLPRSKIKNIDDLPLPDYSFAESFMRKSQIGYMITSRGCPNRCQFCSTSSYWGQKVRMNSPKHVVDEMESLIKKYGVKKIFFHDDTFNLGISRVREICKLIKKRKLKVEWGCSCRVVPVSEQMIKDMISSGCRYICWGVESGSQKMLNSIGKNITLKQVKTAFNLTAKYSNVLASGTFRMVGNPGENESTVKETIDFFNDLPMTDQSGCSILYILPGTSIYANLKKEGKINEDCWYKQDGVPYYTIEHSYSQLKKWSDLISASGKIIPFDKNNHFFSDKHTVVENGFKSKISKMVKRIKLVIRRPKTLINQIKFYLPAGKIRFK
jgi:radical SAM superfamily enzyme YgiQ (UPF0313 family)